LTEQTGILVSTHSDATGSAPSGGASLGIVPVAWTVSGAADFNGDGKADVLWTNSATGDRAMWLMNGSVILTNAFLPRSPWIGLSAPKST
jgi:hypothetical protein